LSIDEKRRCSTDTRPPANPGLRLLPIACGNGRGLTALARDLSSVGVKATILPNRDIDAGCHSLFRKQHRADALIRQARRATAGRVLAITDVDLYSICRV
jgi:hypothetical protein